MNIKAQCILLGAGGHAAVLLDAIQASDGITAVGILDADKNRWNTELMGVPILGDDDWLDGAREHGVTHFVIGLAQVGPSPLRRRLFERAVKSRLKPYTVRHPVVIVSPHAVIEDGAQILAGAIVNSRAHVGRAAIINTGAIVEHDVKVGAFAHLAPRACVCGGVLIGENAFIGAGAVIIQGVQVGANATIGAGAVVVRDVPDGVCVMGVPAREVPM